MTVNSLANFGVPGLNGDRGPALMPVLSNRFRALFYNFGNNGEVAPFDLTRQIKTFERPKMEFEHSTLWTYVSAVYITTRGEWGEMRVVFTDDITNTVMRRVEQQKAKQQNFFDQTMSRAGENYKFEMDLDILAGGATAGGSAADPNIIQKWCYAGCQLKSIEYGEMTYEDAKPMEINCTIRFDNCIGFDHNGGRMGTFSHTPEISSQSGVLTTGTGGGGFNISIGGASVNVGFSGVSVGGATLGGSIGAGGNSFGVNF